MRKDEIMKTQYCTDEQLDAAINAETKPCAAPCNVPLSACNIVNGDLVHGDCYCGYPEGGQLCREPLLELYHWQPPPLRQAP
jgi:hypothetical protein